MRQTCGPAKFNPEETSDFLGTAFPTSGTSMAHTLAGGGEGQPANTCPLQPGSHLCSHVTKQQPSVQKCTCHWKRCSWLPGPATRHVLASASRLTAHGCGDCSGLLKKPCFAGRPCCPTSAGAPLSVSCHRVRHTVSALPLPKPARPTMLPTGSKVQHIGDGKCPCTSDSQSPNHLWHAQTCTPPTRREGSRVTTCYAVIIADSQCNRRGGMFSASME